MSKYLKFLNQSLQVDVWMVQGLKTQAGQQWPRQGRGRDGKYLQPNWQDVFGG